ncbi:anti-H(O) lectin 1-like [Tripterygium wilfordii]|uniref:anti-H(O) lectin 1-like n=1 Tax=Tripterygium wilfordii TaxID=458696 RepID=UPI0018F83395|nr:anti-H(O) lectin 1-like [Tripterygium wilfordii]
MSLLLLLIAIFLNQASLNQAYDDFGPIPAPAPAPRASATIFSFPSFDSESCYTGKLICTGTVTAGNGHLSLTPEPQPNVRNFQIGRVLYKHPVRAWPAIISTTFTFRIKTFLGSPGNGDGMAFVMAPDDRPSPDDSFGSYLGLMERQPEVRLARRQLAVEFDTYKNDFDADGNHFAVDTTSVKHDTQPIILRSLNDTSIDLKSGTDIKVRIDYNGWTKLLQISIGYASESLVEFPPYSIDISTIVPQYIYVGFAASTGAFTESHQLLNWDFISSTQ